MTQCCFSNQRGKSSSCFFSSGLKRVNRLLIYLLFTVITYCPSGFSSRQKDHKEPAMRTSEQIKFYYSLQSNQSCKIKKHRKLGHFSFSCLRLSFFFKLNGQNKFILRPENILKKNDARDSVTHVEVLHSLECQ